MKKHRRIAALLMALCALLTGCGRIVPEEPEALNLYASFYPVYAIASMLTEGVPDLSLRCLVQPQDGCVRDYALSDWDAALLSRAADAVLVSGRGLESFADSLEDESASVAVVKAAHGLDLFSYHGEILLESEESHFVGENPFLYMSLEGAMRMAENIAGALSLLDPRYDSLYQSNLTAALGALQQTRDECAALLSEFEGTNVAVMNEALFYVARDYGLNVAAAADRESGAMLSDSDLRRCVEAFREKGVSVILIEEQAPKRLCDRLAAEGFSVAKLDIMTALTESEGAAGYFTAQKENARRLNVACAAGANQ